MQIETRQLRQFLAVVELQSFTAAAEKLLITQPVLTRTIQQLESRFGVKLIERGSKSFQLTSFGRMLVERARLIEQEFAQIDLDMVALKGGETGSLRIGCGPSGISFLPQVVIAFQQQRPNVQVKLIADSMDANLAALLNGDLDLFCSAIEFPRQSTLHCERLLEIRNIVVASKTHPLAGRTAIEPKSFLDYPWAAFANDDMARSRMSAYLAASELDLPRIAFETNNLMTMFSVLAASNYLACVPPLVLDDAKAHGLTALNIKGSFWSVGLGIAHLNTAHLPSALTTFIAILRAHILTLKTDNPSLFAS